MHHFLHPGVAAPVATLALLSAPIGAQTPPITVHGPASRLASGLSLSEVGRPVANRDHQYLRPPVDALTATAPWTVNRPVPYGQPSHAMQALFPDYWETIEIDAQSDGGVMMPPILSGGFIDLQTPPWDGRWFGLVFSLADDATGVAGSVIESQRGPSGARKIGSDLFSYFWPESTGIDSTLLDRVILESTREDLGLAATADIDALDYPIGVNYFTPQLASRFLFESTGLYFFSVTKEWADSSESDDFLGVGINPDPATIYYLSWDGSAWSLPQVYVTRDDLGLAPLGTTVGEVEDIDALMIGRSGAGGGGMRVIFSSKVAAGHPQLLTFNGTSLSTPQPLMVAEGLSADVAFGLGANDELDGGCPLDPEPSAGNPNKFLTPTDVCGGKYDLPPNTVPMGISATLASVELGPSPQPGIAPPITAALVIELSGWGGTTPVNSIADLYLALYPGGPEVLFDSYPRSATQDLFTVTIPIDPYVAPMNIGLGFKQRPEGGDTGISAVSYIGFMEIP